MDATRATMDGARGVDATKMRAMTTRDDRGRGRRATRDGARGGRARATTRATATASDVGRGKAAIVVGGGGRGTRDGVAARERRV